MKHSLLISALAAVIAACSPKTPPAMTVSGVADKGQFVVSEDGKPVLQYNYNTVNEDDVIRPSGMGDVHIEYFPIDGVYLDEYYKANPWDTATRKSSAIWAQPRSDYVHPLYGFGGEMLTCDWPDASHPHHRGIFWAWPEVEYKGQRGDLYALQRVFARPTGKVKCKNGNAFAEIEAVNQWVWKNFEEGKNDNVSEAIVRETVNIRVYKAEGGTRIIDFTIRLKALADSVTIATRFTNSYGSFNMKMAKPQNQQITLHLDTMPASPLRAWADFSGTFAGQQEPSGVTLLQNTHNPEYPSRWIEYPDLQWLQPVFPRDNTRYLLRTSDPLTLRYRLIVHKGGKASDEVINKQWDEYN